MAATESNMMPLGTTAPHFKLPDALSDESISLGKIEHSTGLVVIFMCNHCPYVKHLLSSLIDTARTYLPQGIDFVAISSNDTQKYPEDSYEEMKNLALEKKFPFPYLYDESQEIAKAYDAACTPDFYLFDANLNLVYRGQYDDSRPGNDLPINGESLKQAMDALIANDPIPEKQKPSIGCNIKWKN